MAEMDEVQLGSIVSGEITDALNYFDSEYSQDRLRALDFYMGEPLGNEMDGRSSVIATELADTVEAIMPNLMRVFTTNDKYVRFAARTAEDVEAAEQASDYVNYIIQNQNDGFKLLHTFFKDALLFRMGVIKYFYEESEQVDEEEYSGLSPAELTYLLNDPSVEIVEQNENVRSSYVDDDGETQPLDVDYDLSVRVTRKSGQIKAINVPPEEFLVSKHCVSLDEATFLAHRTSLTVSELVAMGYDRDLVEQYAGESEIDNDREVNNRFEDLEAARGEEPSDPTLRSVIYYECIMNVDFDGDGIAERRRICAIGPDGDHILHNEAFDHVPFAVCSPIMMPHRLIGRSIYDLTEDLQVIKTTLMRQYLDSVYSSTLPRMIAVEGQVNLDDLLDGSAGGIIRARQPGMVQQITGASVGGEIRPLMDYLDSVKENRTGMSKASMGLSPDALQSSTASAVAATVRGAQVKLESYARVMAETGLKDLMKGILHLVLKHDNKPKVFRLRNNFVPINPAEWKSQFDTVVQVGLGTTDDETKIAFLTQVAGKQEQILLQMGPQNPIVSMEQYVNTLRSIAEIGGFKDVDQFFNSPQMIRQQQMMQQQQPPKPDPAMMKLQQELEMDKAKAQAQIQLEREKMQAEIELEREKMIMEMELRRQELQAEAELRVAKAVTDSDISTNLPRN
ncbi:MAG: hypothetical protein DWQ28_06490 [Proteobacteria bacterium]|nr:MAG: hypothetical protein DWQ28_06185 [Pseudomonadota bacterium]REJ67680.1 MAG: hypothetical protein DWQ28_06490 [Pseudomonadota bacterium]